MYSQGTDYNNNDIYQPMNTFNPNNFLNDYLYGLNYFNNMPNSQLQNLNTKQNPFFLDRALNIFNSGNNKEKNEKNKNNNSEENKFLLFFRSHNFTNDNGIIKRDEIINEKKKNYEILSNNLEDEMKCCICLNRYVEPLLCPYCHHFFCKDCINKWYDENKNSCVYCRKRMAIESFIKISSFEKIITFLDVLKENNKNFFNYQIKNNIDKIIVLCSNKIHEKNELEKNSENTNNNNDKEDNKRAVKDKDEGNECYENLEEIQADYYCFDCKKPFCSDCICINDDYSNCGHSNDHFVFNIEALNEMKLFDLLYEKENNNTIHELEIINEKIKESINKLGQKKTNTLLFIEFIKNTFIDLIEKKINKLKDVVKDNEKEINKIKNKFNEIDNFINKLKFEQNIKSIKSINEIQTNLNMIYSFNIFLDTSKNIINQNLLFKGNIQFSEIINKIIERDKILFDPYICTFNYSSSLIIINENYKIKDNINPFLIDIYDKNNKNNINKIKLLVKYKKNLKEHEENKFFFPIIFNNENKYVNFEEIKPKDDIFFLRNNCSAINSSKTNEAN